MNVRARRFKIFYNPFSKSQNPLYILFKFLDFRVKKLSSVKMQSISDIAEFFQKRFRIGIEFPLAFADKL